MKMIIMCMMSLELQEKKRNSQSHNFLGILQGDPKGQFRTTTDTNKHQTTLTDVPKHP